MYPDRAQLKEIIVQAAERELLPRYHQVGFACKADGSMVTEADIAMQQYIQDRLNVHWPQYKLLGEEMSEAEQRHQLQSADEGLWILDPLDGTSNFAAGLPFFSISLALLVKGQPVIGLVYDPVRKECFYAERGKGAWLNDQPLVKQTSRSNLKQCLAAVDFKRLSPNLARRLAEAPPYGSQRSLGSVALDWCWLAANRFHLYLHGKQKLWDYAAGILILDEVGGYSATLGGEPVFVADVAPRSALATLDRGLFNQWQQWLTG
jgi:myo-inositol-1(or 4)-monophosphatase